MNERILTLAGEIAGSDSSAALLESLCEAAVAYWKRRLPANMEAEDCGAAFVCAAAFTVAADLLAGSGGRGEDFTVGEVSVRAKSAADTAAAARTLRDAAEQMMRPYAVATDFAFLGVRG